MHNKYTNKGLILVFLVTITFIALSAVSTVSADGSVIYVSGSGGNDAWDGQSLIYNGTSGPKKSIKNATATVINGGTLNIANGVYTGVNNTIIVINKNITLTGQSKTGTVINGANTQNIFAISPDVNVIIQNLTIINGNGGNGGAINTEGNLTVINCVFTGNKASNCGGAICSMKIRSPIYLIVNGCTFTGNKAGNCGGAISGDCTLNIASSTFTSNSAGNCGGAIEGGRGNLTVTSCIFTSNAVNNSGGAIVNSGTSIITYSKFTSNKASNCGGAIDNDGNSIITHGSFISNTARLGYAISNSMGSVNAAYNWWGSNAGPSSGMISGSVKYTPWSTIKTAPKVSSTSPKNGAAGISRTSTIKIKFSDKIKASINWSKIYVKNKYGKKVSISKSISGNYLYIKTSKRSSYSSYTVYIPASAVKDYAGNTLAKYYIFKFKTGR